MSTREDRIKGVLVGQAAGDALGAGYETGKPSHGKAEMTGGGFGFEPGEWTDDTDQAVCVALACSEPLKVAEYLLDWYRGRPKDVGGTTARVLSSADLLGDAGRMAEAARMYARQDATWKRPAHWDPGMANGSLMRTGPVCLPFLGDRNKIASRAREISDLTHPDGFTGDACVLWSLAIDRAITLRSAFTIGEVYFGGIGHIPGERREFWQVTIGEAMASTRPPGRNGSAVGAFKAALHAVSNSHDYEGGVQAAIALGGDTDTVAAIAGALLGAIHGASAIPGEWYSVLHGWSPNGRATAADLERIALEAASS